MSPPTPTRGRRFDRRGLLRGSLGLLAGAAAIAGTSGTGAASDGVTVHCPDHGLAVGELLGLRALAGIQLGAAPADQRDAGRLRVVTPGDGPSVRYRYELRDLAPSAATVRLEPFEEVSNSRTEVRLRSVGDDGAPAPLDAAVGAAPDGSGDLARTTVELERLDAGETVGLRPSVGVLRQGQASTTGEGTGDGRVDVPGEAPQGGDAFGTGDVTMRGPLDLSEAPSASALAAPELVVRH